MTELSAKLTAWQWLNAFAPAVPKSDLKKRVIGDCNFLWHIFSWELVPCLKEDEARKAFDALEYDRAIMFHFGYSHSGRFDIKDHSFTGKVSAADLDEYPDVYIVAPDLLWTYVHTHESSCGPYFCRRQP